MMNQTNLQSTSSTADPLQDFYDYKDSEYYKLEVKDSSIPGSGKGLFASKPIRKGQFILEYYGSVIDSKYCNGWPFEQEDKMVYINSKYCVISRGPSSRANDIILWEPEKYNTIQHRLLRQRRKVKTIEGKYRNAQISIMPKDKAFIVATEDIKVGQQIHVDYGFEYWDFFLKRAAQSTKSAISQH